MDDFETSLAKMRNPQHDYEAQQKMDELAERIIEVLLPMITNAIQIIKALWDAILHAYPNKHIVWLAMHHKKERVRKKNMARILKWIEKEVE